MSAREIVIGLHLYQPPRRAFHQDLKDRSTDPQGIDWTERIFQECYRRLVDERILTLASFDIYGTLRHELKRIDRNHSQALSRALKDHGVGEPYLHPILPDLCHEDKEILIGAGYEDFRRTTGKAPQVFWPPETALDQETLTVLAPYYRAVLCAPSQIRRRDGLPADNRPTRIGLGRHSILALPFDGYVSNKLGFDAKLDADRFVGEHILPALRPLDTRQRLIGWTDAETFGHHYRQGDLFLQYLLFHSLPDRGVIPVSINELLRADTDPGEGQINHRTAWSCDHGDLRRWHEPCPCGYGDLTWKGPFYAGLHTLNAFVSGLVRDKLGPQFKDELITDFSKYLENPGGKLSRQKDSLLSAKASALAGVTSCGTFYDNPHTSGHINALFALQSLYHLVDASLMNEAERGRQILREHWLPKAGHFRSSSSSPFSEILR